MFSLYRTTVLCLAAALLLLSGCAVFTIKPGLRPAIAWDDLPGWDDDQHEQVWPAFLHNCDALAERDKQWRELCITARAMEHPGRLEVRRFFEHWFDPHPLTGKYGRRKGLITGYYEPLLHGSLTPDNRFRYPLYGRPNDLLAIDLGALYPELKGKRVRGRLQSNRVVPYYDRRQLDNDPSILSGHVLAWMDDPVDLFFLHIQGSGRILLPDQSMMAVGYADHNGHPYRSIGRELVTMGELDRDEVDLFAIRAWLKQHPLRMHELMHRNPSYVFFSRRPANEDGPLGSLNVPLTPERSMAVDRSVVPLGTPVWLDTTLPRTRDGDSDRYQRLVMAQDTGGAIKGEVRADLFWGRGARARDMAGRMKQEGRLYVLLPKSGTSSE